MACAGFSDRSYGCLRVWCGVMDMRKLGCLVRGEPGLCGMQVGVVRLWVGCRRAPRAR
jgi:hypothetical protein